MTRYYLYVYPLPSYFSWVQPYPGGIVVFHGYGFLRLQIEHFCLSCSQRVKGYGWRGFDAVPRAFFLFGSDLLNFRFRDLGELYFSSIINEGDRWYSLNDGVSLADIFDEYGEREYFKQICRELRQRRLELF